jgi:hypothetical protein
MTYVTLNNKSPLRRIYKVHNQDSLNTFFIDLEERIHRVTHLLSVSENIDYIVHQRAAMDEFFIGLEEMCLDWDYFCNQCIIKTKRYRMDIEKTDRAYREPGADLRALNNTYSVFCGRYDARMYFSSIIPIIPNGDAYNKYVLGIRAFDQKIRDIKYI